MENGPVELKMGIPTNHVSLAKGNHIPKFHLVKDIFRTQFGSFSQFSGWKYPKICLKPPPIDYCFMRNKSSPKKNWWVCHPNVPPWISFEPQATPIVPGSSWFSSPRIRSSPRSNDGKTSRSVHPELDPLEPLEVEKLKPPVYQAVCWVEP